MEQNGQTNAPQQILQRITEDRKNSIHIARVPPKTKEEFVALAHEDFCDDYGMALKWLLDEVKRLQAVAEAIYDHEERIGILEKALLSPAQGEAKTEEIPEGCKKMADGTIRRVQK